ncbi:recombinase family protein [Edaphobacter aggregans]|uniref:recombinase family protein n=1 Tax=Edaphobacter aggregans TaxID=570835 RepID=UPI00068F16F0|nr:recombinase family protein [Edaphobacter aggregans]
MKVGYARVSTTDQSLDAQIDALKRAGCRDHIFQESVSSTSKKRPELDRCLQTLKKGDTLVVFKLDRLGRSVHFLLELVQTLGKRGINLVSLHDPIDTTTPMGVAIFQFSAVMAQLEKGMIRERTMAGLKAARDRGRFGGAPQKTSPQQRAAIGTMWDSGKHSGREIAEIYNISKATVFRILAKRKAATAIKKPARRKPTQPR